MDELRTLFCMREQYFEVTHEMSHSMSDPTRREQQNPLFVPFWLWFLGNIQIYIICLSFSFSLRGIRLLGFE